MHTEASAEYNKDVSTIVSKLYSLRCIECSRKSMKKKYTKASPLLKKITQELLTVLRIIVQILWIYIYPLIANFL